MDKASAQNVCGTDEHRPGSFYEGFIHSFCHTSLLWGFRNCEFVAYSFSCQVCFKLLGGELSSIICANSLELSPGRLFDHGLPFQEFLKCLIFRLQKIYPYIPSLIINIRQKYSAPLNDFAFIFPHKSLCTRSRGSSALRLLEENLVRCCLP